MAAPGVLTLATGAPVPPYPFYAEANHPVTPSSEVKDPSGSYALSAKAVHQQAEGLAAVHFGGPDTPVSRVASKAAGRVEASGATVTAVSIGEGFRFGDGLLTIASGTSRSVTTYAAGADEPVTTSELLIVGAKVGDQAVTIGPDGVQPVGQSVSFPGGAEQLHQALSAAGITVRTLSLRHGEGTATTEALQVTVKHPVPGSDVEGTLVYQFGGSTSFISFGADVPGLPAQVGGSDPTLPGDLGAPPLAPPTAGAAEPSAPGSPAGLPSTTPAPAPAYPAPGTPFTPFFGGNSLAPADTDPGALPAELHAPSALAAPSDVAAVPVALNRPELKEPARLLMAVLAAAGAILLAWSTSWRRARP